MIAPAAIVMRLPVLQSGTIAPVDSRVFVPDLAAVTLLRGLAGEDRDASAPTMADKRPEPPESRPLNVTPREPAAFYPGLIPWAHWRPRPDRPRPRPRTNGGNPPRSNEAHHD